VLTFDDGYRDFYDTVLPILERYQMRASLFVPTGYLGKTARWLGPVGESDRPIIDAAQLLDIATSGLVDIGAHSHSHPALDLVDAARRRAEIHLPRLVLEDLLQHPVSAFAYPFGYFTGSARRDAAEAGYEVAYGVGERHVMEGDDPLAIPRFSVGPEVTPETLLSLVGERSGRVDRATTAVKRHAWRQLRRVQRRPEVPPASLPDIPTGRSASLSTAGAPR
jgi:peptidoglycan/xylan/chitin deacetylase (PgdA/CDA1 family)